MGLQFLPPVYTGSVPRYKASVNESIIVISKPLTMLPVHANHNNETHATNVHDVRLQSNMQPNFNHFSTSNFSVIDMKSGNPSQFGTSFMILFCLQMLAYGLFEPVGKLIDAAVFSSLGREKLGHFGRVFIFAVFGFNSFSFIVGYLIDVISKHVSSAQLSYLPMTCGYSICLIFTGMLACTYRPLGPIESKTFGKDVGNLFKRSEYLVLLFASFLYGILFGIQMTFVNWFLMGIGAPHLLIGRSK